MSISAFNDAPLVVTRTRVVVVVVGCVSAGRSRGSRTSVLLLSLDRGGNPRFDINLSTPLSERCSPSFANAALSTAPLRNVKLLSLSTKVALFSSQVARS